MPRWRCTATVVGGKYLGEVEAETEEQAKERAEELGTAHVSLCHACAEQCEDAEISEVSVELITEQEAEAAG